MMNDRAFIIIMADGKEYLMACAKCGKELPGQAQVCPHCLTPVPAPATPAPAATAPAPATGTGTAAINAATAAADKVKTASQDAWAAFKKFALNPVGGLPEVCESLGAKRALEVGLVFGAVSAICIVAGIYMTHSYYRVHGFKEFLKISVIGLTPFISLSVWTYILKKVFRSEGSFGYDCYTAGGALLPPGLVYLLQGILIGEDRLEIRSQSTITVLWIFAVCLGLFILFAALTRIHKLSERVATFIIPLAISLTGWNFLFIYDKLI